VERSLLGRKEKSEKNRKRSREEEVGRTQRGIKKPEAGNIRRNASKLERPVPSCEDSKIPKKH